MRSFSSGGIYDVKTNENHLFEKSGAEFEFDHIIGGNIYCRAATQGITVADVDNFDVLVMDPDNYNIKLYPGEYKKLNVITLY